LAVIGVSFRPPNDRFCTGHQSTVDNESAENMVVAPKRKTARRTRIDRRHRPKRQPRYQVLLWNDNAHSFEYVILMLADLFGVPHEKGLVLAQEVHQRGKTSCITTTREHAELKQEQIHAYGADPLMARCQGSMSATIEPIDD